MPPNLLASIIIAVPTYNSVPHVSLISLLQDEFNATK